MQKIPYIDFFQYKLTLQVEGFLVTIVQVEFDLVQYKAQPRK